MKEKKKQRSSEATTLSSPKYNTTKYPFIIFHFYDLLKKTIKELDLEYRPDLVWFAIWAIKVKDNIKKWSKTTSGFLSFSESTHQSYDLLSNFYLQNWKEAPGLMVVK